MQKLQDPENCYPSRTRVYRKTHTNKNGTLVNEVAHENIVSNYDWDLWLKGISLIPHSQGVNAVNT